MRAARWALRVLVAAGLTLALVGLSLVPWSPEAAGGGASELRLAWRFRSTLVDACRRLSASELANLPVHMRRDFSCERRLTPYELVVTLDEAAVLTDTVHARGARADRPLSLFHALPLSPGRHALRLRFAPLVNLAEPEHESDGDDHDDRPVPPTLVLDTALTVAPYRVVLVTLDEARGVLVVR